MRKLVLSLFLSVCMGVLYGQSLNAYEKAGSKAYEEGDFYYALSCWKKVVETDPSRDYLWYPLAEAARHYKSYRIAEKAYEKALESQNADDYPEALLWLGTVKQQLGKYEKAIYLLEKYLTQETSTTSLDDYSQARKYLLECRASLALAQNRKSEISVSPLPGPWNSPFSETAPAFLRDSLLFSTLSMVQEPKAGYELSAEPRLLFKTSTGKWMEGPFPLHNGRGLSDWAWDEAFNRLFCSKCSYEKGNRFSCSLIRIDRNPDGSFGRMVELPASLNSPGYSTSHPALGYTPDGKDYCLYFSSDRPGGAGGKDIWFSRIGEKGEFKAPENLSQVNSPEDEVTPRYDKDSKILYFSSNGRRGLGGFDIFFCNWNEKGETEIRNPGLPLNSSFDDLGFVSSPEGQKAYFISNRSGALSPDEIMENCCFDLFQADFSEIKLEVVPEVQIAGTEEQLHSFSLKRVDFGTQPGHSKVTELPSKATCTFPGEGSYALVAVSPGFSPDTLWISTRGLNHSRKEKHVFSLEKAEPLIEVAVFDRQSGRPLNGVKVTLELSGHTQSIWKRDFEKHIYYFPADEHAAYRLIVGKEGYEPDTVSVSYPSPQDLEGGLLRREIFLNSRPNGLTTLSAFLPLSLFFDKDQPDPENFSEKKITYTELATVYYLRKELYLEKLTNGLPPFYRERVAREVEHFFEQEVRLGAEKLQDFLRFLENYLEDGNEVVLVLEGYARIDEPDPDKLAARRIQALVSHMRIFEGGALIPFLESGQLRLEERPRKNDRPSALSLDIFRDEKRSGFNVLASRERRVELAEIHTQKEFAEER